MSRPVGLARRGGSLIPPAARVWALIGLMLSLAVIVHVHVVRGLFGGANESLVPWFVLAAGFSVTELKVVDVHFRGERHAFSLSEIPGVIALFLLSPEDFLLAVTAGTAAALWIDGRQSALKRSFNIANTVLGAVVALAVFHAIAIDRAGGPLVPPSLLDWAAAGIATGIVSVIGATAVASVISLSGAAPQISRLADMIRFGGLVALANTSLALLAVTVLAIDPRAVLLLVVPVATVFFAYRAYVSEREKHERLALLYQTSRILQHSPELDSATASMLDHARGMFGAEAAVIALFPDPASAAAVRTTVADGAVVDVMVPFELPPEHLLRRRAMTETRGFFAAGEADTLFDRPIRQAMASPLVGAAGPIGVMLVANRVTQGTTFSTEDLRILETVANQVAVALENGQLERSLAELARLKDELRHQAFHDALTGLPNRAFFTDQVSARLATATEGAEPVVMFLDLDDFKVVNDTLGHAVGDELLLAVAERIRGCIRSDDLAARLGGDEFAVLLAEPEGMTEALLMANRLVDVLGVAFPLAGQDVLVGASVGIATARGVEERADDLLRNADVAMYTAKANGKRRIAVFDPLMHAELVARHELSGDLARALQRGDLFVHYQPMVELATGRPAGVEALVRWRHPRRGLVPPDEFIRLAEENGTIRALGHWVLTSACLQTARWRDAIGDGAPFFVSVNVSPHQIQAPDFVEEVGAILATTGLRASELVLEVTETAMFQDPRGTIEKLQALKDRGVRIAVDDFGTGWSSLSYLRRFPVDILKIAREFIGEPIDSTEDDWAFAHAIVALGRTLRLAIVAEGIEHAGQHHRLRELECEYGQGFLYHAPASAADTQAWLHERRAGATATAVGAPGHADWRPQTVGAGQAG